MPRDHPRRRVLEEATLARTSRKEWSKRVLELTRILTEDSTERKPIQLRGRPTWNPNKELEVFSSLPGITGKTDEKAKKRRAAIERINSMVADLVAYTNMSATVGCKKGGSAAVITTGDAIHPEMQHVIRRKGANHTLSYEEECQALEDALQWIKFNTEPDSLILICTDSQSMCMALSSINQGVHKPVRVDQRMPSLNINTMDTQPQ